MYSLVLIGITAFLLALLATPLVRDAARRWGALDKPDATRKNHSSAVPRVGGIAVAFAYAASFAILLLSQLRGGELLLKSIPTISRLLPAVTIILAFGLLDDLLGLKPREKLVGQIGAAFIAFIGGLRIESFAGNHFPTWFSLPATIAWLLLCTNAFNLIDGVDGLAAGVALFATCSMMITAFTQGNVPLALATVPLAGALLGFLRYNFNPASIFLGDSGSLFLGFLLGCYGVLWSEKSATMLGITAPVIALAIPLLDTVLAILRRFLRQQPIFGADRGHIHHRLLDRGLSPRQVVLVLYGCCAVGAACSLAVSKSGLSLPGLVTFFAFACVGIVHLGYAEFDVFGRMFVSGAFRGLLNSHISLHTLEAKIAAAHTPDACWEVVLATAAEFGFPRIEMHLAGRAFTQGNPLSPQDSWHLRIPLAASDYILLTRDFDSASQAGAIAPFAEALRRALLAKQLTFSTVRMRLITKAAHGD